MSDPDLRSVTLELARLVDELSQLSGEKAAPHIPRALSLQLRHRTVALRAGRRRRQTVFAEQAHLFGEPAWDILIDLFIAHLEGRAVDITGASIAANAPPTTGLRYIAALIEAGLIGRSSDLHDRRRHHVWLTATGVELMTLYVSDVPEIARNDEVLSLPRVG
jgi:hypothetical protein